jgi:hypothetical protein
MLDRRKFISTLAAFVPATALVRHAHTLAIEELIASPQTLDALGLAILPSELGEAQMRRVVASFRKWLDDYKEGAELLHGYGSSRLTFAGPTPATRFASQLDALEAAAKSKHGRGFSALTLDERRALAREALAGERGAGMQSPDRANHVTAALLGFFYTSPQATDLCYLAAIGRNTCRPLAKSSERPT